MSLVRKLTFPIVAVTLTVTCIQTAMSAEKQKDTRASLQPAAMQPLPLGTIKPDGWIKRQLQIQANGLSGHLDEFWPDVKNSAWIGGTAEGWERGPYWLDGFLPLAIHLDDPVLKARAQRWVDYILTHPQPDGWLGPIPGNPSQTAQSKNYDTWPRFILLKALIQWHEATGDQRVIPASLALLRRMNTVLDEYPLKEWARMRWADLVLSIHWLYDRTGEAWLLDLASKVRSQGLDWGALGSDFPYKDPVPKSKLQEYAKELGGAYINDKFGVTHGVNIGMGIKAPGVWFRQSGDPRDRQGLFDLLAALDRYHGQPNGIFSCDEHLAGLHPSQGTELCTVVEMMYSLETLLPIIPDTSLADRLERLAYNALPATFSDDMWSHQYVQQANQVVCKVSQERLYTDNNAEANLFGLEPHFGCCLANLHQGWPKFVSHLWMKSDDGLAAISYAPCRVRTHLGHGPVEIVVRGNYPFAETLEIAVRTGRAIRFPLKLRVPDWAKGASVSVAGKSQRLRAGTFNTVDREWSGETVLTLTLPMKLRSKRGVNESVSIHRGPLLFALDVKAEWRKLRDRGPTADWEVHPVTAWNYALVLKPNNPAKYLALHTQALADVPFSSSAPAVWLTGTARPVPSWKEVKNAADLPPRSPVKTDEPEQPVRLLPYGAAKLRVTALPVTNP